MRVLITRGLPSCVLRRAQALFDVTLRDIPAPLSRAEATAALQEYDAILPTLGDDFSAQSFAARPPKRCRLLANFGVGYNHIDVTAAQAAGIAVTNTPGAVTDATADIALMLMLMTCRRAGEAERLLRAGKWQGWHPVQLLGQHMTGKTVGIIGMGRIGQAVAQRCSDGFKMKVVYYNRSPKAIKGATPLAQIKQVMSQADIIVLAVPGGAQTRHLIGKEQLCAMQRHGILINIARGDVVDEAALIAALQSGQIAGAGLDVYEHEPHIPAALCALENVTLLPHLGTAAQEVREAMGMMAVDNLEALSKGMPLPNLV